MMEARVCCFLVLKKQLFYGIGLMPREYADRILDACSIYILHACSDPFPVSKRAGKRWKLETTYTEDGEGNSRPHHRLRHDWRVPETAVMQQQEGQAFWIYKGRAQQVHTAQVPIAQEQVDEGWDEIRHQEDWQRTVLEQQARKRQRQAQPQKPTQPPALQSAPPDLQLASNGAAAKGKTGAQQQKSAPVSPQSSAPVPKASPPVPNPDDDEPDEL